MLPTASASAEAGTLGGWTLNRASIAVITAASTFGGLIGATVGNVDGIVPISEIVGYMTGMVVAKSIDIGLTGFGFYNDVSRTPLNAKYQWIPPFPTMYSAGVMWKDVPFIALLRHACPPTYCEEV